MTQAMRLVGALMLSMLLAAPALSAQRPVRVDARQDISFGTVFPGVPVTVAPSSSQSAQFSVTGPKFTQAVIVFTLPNSMTSTSGGSMQMQYGPTAAAYSPSGSAGDEIVFDPNAPFTITFDNNGKGVIYLGATLLPSGSQRGGNYSATLTLSISPVGL
jgi:hypothetical protein